MTTAGSEVLHSSAPRGGLSRRDVLRTAGIGLFALTVGACSSRPTVEFDGADGGGGGFAAMDMRGQVVEFQGPVQRIVSTVIPAPALIAAVDGSYDRIVGINESTRKADQQGLFSEMFPEAKTTTTVAPANFVPNIETITELQPDVVFQWSDRGDDLMEPLENAGFTTMGLVYGTQQDLEDWIDIFGQVLGKQDRSKEILEWMHTEMARIQESTSSVRTRVRAVHLKASGDGFEARNSTTYEDFWITLAGGTNVAADNVGTDGVVNVEQLIEWDPEVIILGGFDDSTPQDIYGDPSYSSISAVRNRRVYKAPLGAYRWEVPCAESPLMWHWAAAIFHPEIAGQDLRAQTVDRIRFLYDYDLSPAQVDQILRLDLNSGNADVAVFHE